MPAQGVTVNTVELWAVPAGLVTEILPVVAPGGTVAVSFEFDLKAKFAGVPLNVTAVVAVNPLPVMVTTVPTRPLVGVNDVIFGAVVTVKSLVLVAIPPFGSVTVRGPVLAEAGTVTCT